MKLLGFQVTNFRSVKDSGWIDAQQITTLIGTNESGKTNLLLPLWKLNPARDGEIKPLEDYPRKLYSGYKDLEDKPIFVRARFELPSGLAEKLANATKHPVEQMKEVDVSRDFDGDYHIGFPLVKSPPLNVPDLKKQIIELLSKFDKLENPTDEAVKVLTNASKALNFALEQLEEKEGELSKKDTETLFGTLSKVGKRTVSKLGEELSSAYNSIRLLIANYLENTTRPAPEDHEKVVKAIIQRMPNFVYYSNYGNLDSEIYLPHVIDNLKRIATLGPREAAKARTLKVLFDFVQLSPKEILELGREGIAPPPDANKPSQEQISLEAERKRERSVLLQSAESRLTSEFKSWWRQGNYAFRLTADGNHFKVWVSDDKRPEPIELESRSTGLQWFLSFFLVFLVESEDAHADSILLLDEPGLTLHPLAQEDLSEFFQVLSKNNQIIYTTHSPFMVDANNLDRVKAVFVDEEGYSKASDDLRAQEKTSDKTKSVYAVDAALGLTTSRTLIAGCQPVVVEGASDQILLSAMKTLLISRSLISPPKEILFFPAGGVRGVTKLVSVLTGIKDAQPFVILDSDKQGKNMAEQLKKSTYNNHEDRILMTDDFCNLENSEIEDLWPTAFYAERVSKYLRGPEEDFEDVVEASSPIVPQIEKYAVNNNVELKAPGWKVEVAKLVKKRAESYPQKISSDSDEVEYWVRLFQKLTGQ